MSLLCIKDTHPFSCYFCLPAPPTIHRSILNNMYSPLIHSQKKFFFFFLKICICIFIYFWLCWIVVAAPRLSLVAESEGYSQAAVPSLVVEHGLKSTQASVVVWPLGLVALQHVGFSWSRDQTSVPSIGRWILNHWTTREVPKKLILKL